MRLTLIAAALLLAVPAIAQVPEKGPAAVTPQPTTPAPVPNVAAGVPNAAGPTVIPDQIAPPSADSAGPSHSTPFSGNPAGQLPADTSTPTSGAHVGPNTP